MSPLAEGRELKSVLAVHGVDFSVSPLAEGRELKLQLAAAGLQLAAVAPRGGA